MDNRVRRVIHRRLRPRRALSEIIAFVLLLTHALMAFKAVEAATRVQLMARVVLSGSMDPGIKRGDALLFTKGDGPIRVGDVILFKHMAAAYGNHRIVHRAIEVHGRRDGSGVDVLTKGDNNYVDDAEFSYGR